MRVAAALKALLAALQEALIIIVRLPVGAIKLASGLGKVALIVFRAFNARALALQIFEMGVSGARFAAAKLHHAHFDDRAARAVAEAAAVKGLP